MQKEVFIGSGCVSYGSGCGCGMVIPIKKWEECKTLMEKNRVYIWKNHSIYWA